MAVAAVASTAAAAARAEPRRSLDTPRAADIALARGAISDSTISRTASRRVLARAAHWGGTYTASTGEPVTIFVSDAYPEDPATAQRWADFLAGLVHGSELSTVTVYVAAPGEVPSICGPSALACYSPREHLLITPGDDPATELSAEAVVTHEYGHHVAASRSNAPWAAVDYGTKRWASYEQICAEARLGLVFPGAEDELHYALNPGEAFAESYRVLNERRAGLPETAWQIVSQGLYPDDTALAALEQDVTTPWQSATTRAFTGTITKATRVRTYTVSTPLDGTLNLTVRPPAGARIAIDVLTASGAGLARVAGTRTMSATTTVCGARTVRVRVTRVTGAGRFKLTVGRP